MKANRIVLFLLVVVAAFFARALLLTHPAGAAADPQPSPGSAYVFFRSQTPLYAGPDFSAAIVSQARSGDRVVVIGSQGRWTSVSLSAGQSGHILTSSLMDAACAESTPAPIRWYRTYFRPGHVVYWLAVFPALFAVPGILRCHRAITGAIVRRWERPDTSAPAGRLRAGLRAWAEPDFIALFVSALLFGITLGLTRILSSQGDALDQGAFWDCLLHSNALLPVISFTFFCAFAVLLMIEGIGSLRRFGPVGGLLGFCFTATMSVLSALLAFLVAVPAVVSLLASLFGIGNASTAPGAKPWKAAPRQDEYFTAVCPVCNGSRNTARPGSVLAGCSRCGSTGHIKVKR